MSIDRRDFTAALAAASLGAAALPARSQDSAASDGRNVLRVQFWAAETAFDPAAIGDLYSNTVCAHIFESLYGYDPLAVPVRIVPELAVAMPEVSSEFRVWTVRLKRGVMFAPDAAFSGRPRELTSADVVYSVKRVFDPATKSPHFTTIGEEGIVGLEVPRERALAEKKPFDYSIEVEGLRALDRYTVQFRLKAPRPRFLTTLAAQSISVLAREVVEAYGADIGSHPVGTGPYRLKSWRRSSRIELEKNPNYREVRYHSEPAADDAQALAWAKRLEGKRLPLNDGVEIAIIEEIQPRWLSFLGGQADYARVPPELGQLAVPGGKLAPNLVRQGLTLHRYVNSDIAYSFFNMEDPVVGGYTAERVALRRAIQLGYDVDAEIRLIRKGNAIVAQQPLAPWTWGFDPQLRTANGDYDPARAKALLDLYGYVDRDGDGWRERPDGSPLVITMSTEGAQNNRQYDENWNKSMAAIGVRMKFEVAQWPEHYKQARAGKLQMWFLGGTSNNPDGAVGLEDFYSPAVGEGNLPRFRNTEFDALYRGMLGLPDGPERLELLKKAVGIVVAYMPSRVHVHRIYNDVSRPWITGYRNPFFRYQSWHYIEVDGAARAKALA